MPFLHWTDEGSIAIITQWSDRDPIEYEKEAIVVDKILDKILTNAQNIFIELEKIYGPFNLKSSAFYREYSVGKSLNESKLLEDPLIKGSGTKDRPPELLNDKTGKVKDVESGFADSKIGLFSSLGNKTVNGYSHALGNDADRWKNLRPDGKNQGAKRSGKQDNFSRASYLAEQDIENALLSFGGIVDNVSGFHERTNFTLNLKNAVAEVYKLIPEQSRKNYYSRSVTRPMYKDLKALFPATGPGSAKQPVHFGEEELIKTLKNIWRDYLPI
jgi:hypothetical protein